MRFFQTSPPWLCLLIAAWGACAVNGQVRPEGLTVTSSTSSSALSFNFSGSGAGNVSGLSLNGAGILNGSSANLNVSGTASALTITFTFANAQQLNASGSASSGVDLLSGSASITGGTGIYASATGSFTFTVSTSSSAMASGFQFSFTGSGSAGNLKSTAPTAAPQVSASQAVFDSSTADPIQQQLQIQMENSQSESQEINIQTRTLNSVPQNASMGGEGDVQMGILPHPAARLDTGTAGSPAWLSVSPSSATIPAGGSLTLTLTANPAGLNAGTDQAELAITSTASGSTSPIVQIVQNVPVSLVLTSTQTLVLSQTGLSFNTASGAAAQTVAVATASSTPIAFTVAASTVSGGNWLAVTPAVGTASVNGPVDLTVSVSPVGLAPGAYFGFINVASNAAGNSPQSVEVVLSIPPPNEQGSPIVGPTGLLFTSSASSVPAAQTVTMVNGTSKGFGVLTTTVYQSGSDWLTASLSASTLPAGAAATVTVSVNPKGQSPGVYQAILNVTAAALSSVAVNVVMVVAETAAVPSARGAVVVAGCTPTQLTGVFTKLGSNFQAIAGYPVPLEALLSDDCGNPLNSGTVSAAFSTGDFSVPMVSTGQRRWAGTWFPHNAAGGAAFVTLFANSAALSGTIPIFGTLAANAATPIVSAGGVVNAASIAPAMAIAPGAYISIFGVQLADGLSQSTKLPYQTDLGGTQVLLGGEALPLQFVSGNQINAIVPYDVPVNTALQLVVVQNGSASMPETVLIAPASPGVYTQDSSGQGSGVVVAVRPDGTQFEVTPAAPAAAGDALVIYCTGLGAVSPTLAAGSATTSSAQTNTLVPATATVGGVPAQVFFSGMTAGFAGLYQINVFVPSGVTPGSNVPLVVSLGGIASPPVSIALM